MIDVHRYNYIYYNFFHQYNKMEFSIENLKRCRCLRGRVFRLRQHRHQSGMMVSNKEQSEEATFLPLKEINVDVSIQDHIALIKMTQEYFYPIDQKDCDPHKEL